MSPNLTQIAQDFHFSNKERDEKLGADMAVGFFAIGGSAAIIVGYLADHIPRFRLFALVVILGESACCATYWVQTYTQLFFCRILTGLSIGGATPIIFSLLGDLYEEKDRVGASTVIGIAMSTGIAGGQLLAGTIGSVYGWRL